MTSATFSDRVETWQAQGRMESFRGHSIHTFYRDGTGPLLVLLHGFPTSYFDWREFLKVDTKRSVLAFDFLGFGLSDKPRDHSYTLSWQADLTEELVLRYGNARPVHVVAHDLGTSVATELLARDLAGELNFKLDGVLLSNGSILTERANPTLAQKILKGPLGSVATRLMSESFFSHQYRSIFSDQHPVSDQAVADNWALMVNNDGNRLAHKLVSYMTERVIYADRWHGAITNWQGDLRLAWGMQDPVAVPEVLEGLLELHPDLPVTRWEDLGHYPQIEDPPRFAAAVDESMAASGSPL